MVKVESWQMAITVCNYVELQMFGFEFSESETNKRTQARTQDTTQPRTQERAIRRTPSKHLKTILSVHRGKNVACQMSP